MRAVIISDIHGNALYMQKLDRFMKDIGIDRLIILGDLFNSHEEESNIVLEILNSYKDIIDYVKGNCDIHNDKLLFSNEYDAKEIYLDNHKFIMTHGHLKPMLYEYIGKNLVLEGHSHIYNLDGQYINPGSVGRPRVNKEHTFLLYEDNCLKLVDISNLKIIDERKL